VRAAARNARKATAYLRLCGAHRPARESCAAGPWAGLTAGHSVSGMPREAVIVDGVRTPVGRRGGLLSRCILSICWPRRCVIFIQRNRIDPALIDDVIVGCVLQQEQQAGNIGRPRRAGGRIPRIRSRRDRRPAMRVGSARRDLCRPGHRRRGLRPWRSRAASNRCPGCPYRRRWFPAHRSACTTAQGNWRAIRVD